MRISTAVTGTVTITLCLGAILWQSGSISRMEKEARDLREQLVEAPPRSERVGTSPRKSISPLQRGHSSASPRPSRVPSITNLRALWPTGTKVSDRGAATLAISKVVASVEGCSSEELLELAKGLSNPSQESTSNELFIQKLLLIMISEEDPEGALEFWDNLDKGVWKNESVRAAILSQLAKKNPKLALKKWDREGLGRNAQSRCRLAVAQELLRSDPAAALSLLQEDLGAGWGHGLNGILYAPHDSRIAIAAAAQDPDVNAFLWEEANSAKPRWSRFMIIGGLMQAAEIGGGLQAVTDLLQRMENLDGDYRNKLIKKFDSYPSNSSTDFVGRLELYRNNTSGEYRSEAVWGMMTAWARRNPEAAGNWLAAQPASPDRDSMISGYAAQVTEIDPKSALEWIARINDEAVRAKAQERFQLLSK